MLNSSMFKNLHVHFNVCRKNCTVKNVQVEPLLFKTKSRKSISLSKYFIDPSPPPTKSKVQLHGEAKKHQGSRSGVYTLQTEVVNGYPTWKQLSLRNSIWFDASNGKWKIGFTSDLGSKTAGIIGPQAEDDWPQNLSGWKYWNGTKSLDAGSDAIIEDYSKGK